jgi:hypothetical protein
MADRAGVLYSEIAERETEMKAVKEALVPYVEFRDGCATGHLTGRRFAVKVLRKENVKWDQGKLDALRRDMGDEAFFRVFRWSFEPVSKKTLDAVIEFSEHGPRIREAFTSRPGSPQFTFLPLEDC